MTASLKGRPVAVPLFAAGRAGGYAEFVTIDAGSLVPLPDGLAFEDAAALMVQGLTALYLIRQCPPRGKAVLITAAAGGVGSLLVQLAKRAGASLVIAAASSRAKLDLAASLGADICIDYSDASWASRVREVIGGAQAPTSSMNSSAVPSPRPASKPSRPAEKSSLGRLTGSGSGGLSSRPCSRRTNH